MKRFAALILAASLAAPAIAEPRATEIEVAGLGLINRWIAAFNMGDVEAMAADVYAKPDTAALAETFATLHAESFGKLEAYDAAFCGINRDKGRALLTYTRLYTFGGKMNDDEAKVFDIARTETGWRITKEKDVAFGTMLSCD